MVINLILVKRSAFNLIWIILEFFENYSNHWIKKPYGVCSYAILQWIKLLFELSLWGHPNIHIKSAFCLWHGFALVFFLYFLFITQLCTRLFSWDYISCLFFSVWLWYEMATEKNPMRVNLFFSIFHNFAYFFLNSLLLLWKISLFLFFTASTGTKHFISFLLLILNKRWKL